ncbi:MAG: glycosyltransferase, partial [Actinobacteria bacterium]|nr:glycosyltransferase [Actinomycetota bacterium]
IPLTIIIIGVGFFGAIDDLLGSRESTGFKGHIGALLKGRLTTGALKAIGVPVIAILSSSLLSSNLLEIFGNAILIALFVNTLNLLDLKPGRALKFYIPLQLFLIYAVGSDLGPSSAALMGIALILLGPDLKEEIMLGDTGSNILGGILGFCMAATFDWDVKLPVIALLAILQALTEKYSISAIIERTPILEYLDNLGRRTD